MVILKKTDGLYDFLQRKRSGQKIIGFAPTMGALHAGHVSLIQEARRQNDLVVTSIFVNPTQFNDPEDFKKYPVTIEKDIFMVENAGCNVLFIPAVNDIYPQGTRDLKRYELGYLETTLEGKFRPGHFQGVCQVMHRLLEIVLPDNLYLGQKDYQQCMVVKKLIELMGLDHKIKVNICPTFRENDGLAMSSRNTRLDPADRVKAATISSVLRYIKENITQGNTRRIVDEGKAMLIQKGFQTDYVEVANADTLQSVEDWDGTEKIVALAAAILNKIRLIDNMVINP